jgi:hypothetical protein
MPFEPVGQSRNRPKVLKSVKSFGLLLFLSPHSPLSCSSGRTDVPADVSAAREAAAVWNTCNVFYQLRCWPATCAHARGGTDARIASGSDVLAPPLLRHHGAAAASATSCECVGGVFGNPCAHSARPPVRGPRDQPWPACNVYRCSDPKPHGRYPAFAARNGRQLPLRFRLSVPSNRACLRLRSIRRRTVGVTFYALLMIACGSSSGAGHRPKQRHRSRRCPLPASSRVRATRTSER